MPPASWLRHPAQAIHHPQEELQALLARATALQRDSSPYSRQLLGKRLGLMSAEPESGDARLFRQAAQELGAHVALIPAPTEQLEGQADPLPGVGRLLGHLYDAVECQGLGDDMVRALASVARIPIYAGLAGHGHVLFQLARGWKTPAPLIDRRRWLVQAALLAAMTSPSWGSLAAASNPPTAQSKDATQSADTTQGAPRGAP
jgi:ornithine carbamoyltransferase